MRQLYPLVRELIDTGAVALWPISRFTQTIAGVAAAAARQWKAAEEHFRIAMQQAEAFPQRLEQAEIRRFHAMTLLDRAARDDREDLLRAPSARSLVVRLSSLEIIDQTGSLRPIGDEESRAF